MIRQDPRPYAKAAVLRCAGGDDYRGVGLAQRVEGDIAADLDIAPESDAVARQHTVEDAGDRLVL